MLLDGDEIRELPVLGLRAKRTAARLPRARASVPETFVYPIGLPMAPRRVYVLFQQPFDTRTISIGNKTECKAAYEFVRSKVQDSIDTLLELRENDPYDEFFPRVAYETLNAKPAPQPPLGLLKQ
jgi:hypothetical protein